MQVFEALADPTRRKIIRILSKRERSMGDIDRRFPLTPPAISQHLKILRAAKLVAVRIAAQQRIYRVHPTGIAVLDTWITRTRTFWERRLKALERQLRKKAKRKRPQRKKRGKKHAKAQHRR
jgi:DNA-binding transcriptional ArsR family regulator